MNGKIFKTLFIIFLFPVVFLISLIKGLIGGVK